MQICTNFAPDLSVALIYDSPYGRCGPDPGQLRGAVAQTGRAQLNLVRPAGAGLIPWPDLGQLRRPDAPELNLVRPAGAGLTRRSSADRTRVT